MKLIKQKFNQKALKTILSTVLVFSIAVSMSTPQVVSAENQKKPSAVASILDSALGKFFSEPAPAVFPVAGDREPAKTIKTTITAYNSLVGQTDSTPCITANSFNLCEFYEENGYGNTIASNFLPMGTQVRFPELFGDKIFIVRDRMNARYGYGRIDIWMNDYHDAKMFGVKWTLMEVF